MKTEITTIETEIYQKNECLIQFILKSLQVPLVEGQILVLTSKLVSLWEKRVVPSELNKEQLIKENCDLYLGQIGYGSHLTINKGLLQVSAGIDQSNSVDNEFILYPENPYESAKKIHNKLSQHWGHTTWGLIITDSCTRPMRRGVLGVCLSHWGFEGVRSRVGDQDLFGRLLKMTEMSIVDSIAAMSVAMMGEAAECTPLALVKGYPVVWSESCSLKDIAYSIEQDMYEPLIRGSIK